MNDFSVSFWSSSDSKHTGTLSVDDISVKFFASGIPPIVIPISSIGGLFRSKDTVTHVILKIVPTDPTNPTRISDPRTPGSYNFEFITSNKLADREKVYQLIQSRSSILSQPLPSPTPSSSTATESRSSLSSNEVLVERLKRKNLVKKYPALLILHKELVSKKLLPETDFWALHRDLLDLEGSIGNQSSIVSDVPGLLVSSSMVANEISFHMTSADEESIFKEFPKLNELFQTEIDKGTDPVRFWVEFINYKKELLSIDRGNPDAVNSFSELKKKFFQCEESTKIRNVDKLPPELYFEPIEVTEAWPFKDVDREVGCLIEETLQNSEGDDVSLMFKDNLINEINQHALRVGQSFLIDSYVADQGSADDVLMTGTKRRSGFLGFPLGLKPTPATKVKPEDIPSDYISSFSESFLGDSTIFEPNHDLCFKIMGDMSKSAQRTSSRNLDRSLSSATIKSISKYSLMIGEFLRHFYKLKPFQRKSLDQSLVKLRSMAEDFINSQSSDSISLVARQLQPAIQSLNKALS
ncbi:hypothetical protein GEMRC1_007447 [Eukaryota sp. GEM-RC1]